MHVIIVIIQLEVARTCYLIYQLDSNHHILSSQILLISFYHSFATLKLRIQLYSTYLANQFALLCLSYAYACISITPGQAQKRPTKIICAILI